MNEIEKTLIDLLKANGLLGGLLAFLAYQNPTLINKIIESQGLVGGLLIFFIWQNQGVLKRLEDAIKILVLCKDCKYRTVLMEGDETNNVENPK